MYVPKKGHPILYNEFMVKKWKIKVNYKLEASNLFQFINNRKEENYSTTLKIKGLN